MKPSGMPGTARAPGKLRMVEVRTRPSGPPLSRGSSVVTKVADSVPMLVPMSQTGTFACWRR